MTRNHLIILVLSLLLFTVSAANAQKQPITRSEYSTAIYAQYKTDLTDRNRRIETVRETIDSGELRPTFTNVVEYAGAGRRRSYTKNVENGKTSEYEEIKIDYMLYTRKDGGAWTKVDLRTIQSSGYGSGAGATAISCDQYSVENTVIDGTPVKLYESVLIETDARELKFTEERTWLDDAGLARREERVRGKLYPRSETYRQTISYDYNPILKIEAPIP